jgi:hypothetical protein
LAKWLSFQQLNQSVVKMFICHITILP